MVSRVFVRASSRRTVRTVLVTGAARFRATDKHVARVRVALPTAGPASTLRVLVTATGKHFEITIDICSILRDRTVSFAKGAHSRARKIDGACVHRAAPTCLLEVQTQFHAPTIGLTDQIVENNVQNTIFAI